MKTSIDPTNLFRSLGSRKIEPTEIQANQHDFELRHIRPYEVVSPHVQVRFEFVTPTVTKEGTLEYAQQNDILTRPLRDAVDRILNAMKVENIIHGGISILPELESLRDSIAGQQEIVNRFLNSLLTSVSINRSRTGPGTASLTFRIDARHSSPLILDISKNFITDWLLRPHIILTIWSRGRLHTNEMFPRFTGLTVSVAPVSQGGYASIVVEAQDMTKFLAMSIYNINPGMLDPTAIPGIEAESLSFFGKVFWGMESFDILDHLITGNTTNITDPGTGTTLQPARYADVNGVYMYETRMEDKDLEDYYKNRALATQDILSKSITREQLMPFYHIQWGNSLIPYRLFTMGNPDIFQSERRTKWDIIREIATRTYSEFYCDARGSFVFHPIRTPARFLYGLALKRTKTGNLPDIIEDAWRNARVIDEGDIFNFNPVFSDAEVATYVALRGDFELNFVQEELVGLVDAQLEKELAVYFGYRRKDIEVPLLNRMLTDEKGVSSSNLIKRFIEAHMKLINSDLMHCQLTIIDRPELDLGMPILIQESTSVGKKTPVYYYFYIDSISTNITIGGEANMSLGLIFGTLMGDGVEAYKPINFWDSLVQGDLDMDKSMFEQVDQFEKDRREKKEKKLAEAPPANGTTFNNSLTAAQTAALDELIKSSTNRLRIDTLKSIRNNPSLLKTPPTGNTLVDRTTEDITVILTAYRNAKEAINHA